MLTLSDIITSLEFGAPKGPKLHCKQGTQMELSNLQLNSLSYQGVHFPAARAVRTERYHFRVLEAGQGTAKPS